MRTLAAALFALLLAACAGAPPAIPPAPAAGQAGSGTLHIYRPGNLASGGRTAMIHVDGQAADRLSNNGRARIDLGAGTHTIQVGRHSIAVTIEAGKNTFVRYRHGWALFNLIPFDPGQLVEVTAEVAESELGDAG